MASSGLPPLGPRQVWCRCELKPHVHAESRTTKWRHRKRCEAEGVEFLYHRDVNGFSEHERVEEDGEELEIVQRSTYTTRNSSFDSPGPDLAEPMVIDAPDVPNMFDNLYERADDDGLDLLEPVVRPHHREALQEQDPAGGTDSHTASESEKLTSEQGDVEGTDKTSRTVRSSRSATPSSKERASRTVRQSDFEGDGDEAESEEGHQDGSQTISSSGHGSTLGGEDDEDLIDAVGVLFQHLDLQDLLLGAWLETPRWLRLAIRLAKWKTHYGVSAAAFDAQKKLLEEEGVAIPSYDQVLRELQRIAVWAPVQIDCCPRSCMAYTGQYARARRCARCGQRRYTDIQPDDAEWPVSFAEDVGKPVGFYPAERRGRKSYLYLKLIPRLQIQYANPERSRALKEYRQDLAENGDPDTVNDFWDGSLCKTYLQTTCEILTEEHDLTLSFFTDGVSVVKRPNSHAVTPFLLQILNLHPDIRVKRENLMLSFIIPGPHEPTQQLDTWVYPLFQELQQLGSEAGGVRTVDGDTEEEFFLRAWLVLCTGDQKAVNLVMNMKGANSKFGCRQCLIEGKLHRSSYYYRHDQFYNEKGSLDIELLNKVRRSNLRKVIEAVIADGRGEVKKGTGINGRSCFLNVPDNSLHFPRAFPYGMMHMVMIDLAKLLHRLWRGEASVDQKLPPARDDNSEEEEEEDEWILPEYALSPAEWSEIGGEMAACAKKIPLALGRAPVNILTSHVGMRAVAWCNWLLLYSIPLLTGRMPEPYIENLMFLVRGFELAMSKTLTHEEIDEVEELMRRFVEGYEELYYLHDNDPARLTLMTSNVHGVLHLAQSLRECGPMWVSWEMTGERYNGMIGPMASSKLHLDTSIAKATLAEEYLKSADLVRPHLNLAVALRQQREPVYAGGEEVDYGFLLPKRSVLLLADADNHVRQRLRDYFRLLMYPARMDGEELPESLEIFARYKIGGADEPGHMAGCNRMLTGRLEERDNTWIRYQLVDNKGAVCFYYGNVEFFCRAQFYGCPRSNRIVEEGEEEFHDGIFSHHLAFVRHYYTTDQDEGGIGGHRRVKIDRAGAAEFIALHSIDCTVGRLVTHGTGREVTWIISDSVRAIRNPAIDMF